MNRFNLISNFVEPFFKANDIKKDPKLRQKSVRLGVMSIIFSLAAVAFAFGGSLLTKFSSDFMSSQSFLIGLFLFIISIGLLLCSLLFVVYGLLYMISQLSVNRKAIGWIALIVLIASVAGAVLIILFTLGGL